MLEFVDFGEIVNFLTVIFLLYIKNAPISVPGCTVLKFNRKDKLLI